MLKKKGAAALSVREVAKVAGVNLGMFSYHFKNKNEFITRILQDAYAPFVTEMKESQDPNLEHVLYSMAKFSRTHHQSVLLLLVDVLSGEKNVARFLKKNFTAHFTILAEVLTLHFHKNGYEEEHFDHAFRYLVSSVGLPNLFVGLKLGKGPKSKPAPDTDQTLKRRVRAAILGLELICKT